MSSSATIKNESPPVQFTVAKLLMATTSIAILAAVGRLPDEAFGLDYGKLFKAYVALLTIYVWRSQTINPNMSRKTKWLVLLTVFAICLPYLYLSVGSLSDEPDIAAITKWVGVPIWIYAVPFVSFLLFDLNNKWVSHKAFANRTMVELLLFFPWTCVWIILLLLILFPFRY